MHGVVFEVCSSLLTRLGYHSSLTPCSRWSLLKYSESFSIKSWIAEILKVRLIYHQCQFLLSAIRSLLHLRRPLCLPSAVCCPLCPPSDLSTIRSACRPLCLPSALFAVCSVCHPLCPSPALSAACSACHLLCSPSALCCMSATRFLLYVHPPISVVF